MRHQRQLECRGHAFHGDIVVCRAYAARGQHVVEARAELAHVARDLEDDVRQHVHARDVDALQAQLAQEIRCVFVLDLPRQDLVSDDHDPGGRHQGESSRAFWANAPVVYPAARAEALVSALGHHSRGREGCAPDRRGARRGPADRACLRRRPGVREVRRADSSRTRRARGAGRAPCEGAQPGAPRAAARLRTARAARPHAPRGLLAKRALLIVDHGSREPEAAAHPARIADDLRRRRPGLAVYVAHLELIAPSIAAAVAAPATDGVSALVVQPFFLAPGPHAARGAPAAVEAAGTARPSPRVQLTAPLGAAAGVAELILATLPPE